MKLLLRLDGQNFGQTIADTGELSVLRGGGLALLYAPERLFNYLGDLRVADQKKYSVDVVYCGASEGLAYITPVQGSDPSSGNTSLAEEIKDFLSGNAGDDNDQVRKILPYLTFSFAIQPASDDLTADNNQLIHQNRTQQYQSPTVDLLPPPETWQGEKPCAVDKTRPMGEGLEFKKGEDSYETSASVYCRQRYGRDLRQSFYASELKDVPAAWEHRSELRQKILEKSNDVRFANSFDEIAMPPRELQVPEKLRGKMAVLYADGNHFGTTRNETCSKKKTAEEATACLASFSNFVQERRRRILDRIVEEVSGSAYKMTTSRDRRLKTIIPMETLLWGGDEFIIVFPAWSALKVMERIEPLLNKDWEWNGHQLTHALGLVFCHYKTPIREVRDLAGSLADSIKGISTPQDPKFGRHGNYLQYMILMGIDPPQVDLDDYRKEHFRCAAPGAFTFDFNGGFARAMRTLRDFLGLPVDDSGRRGNGVPPSQLYKLRELAIRFGVLEHGTQSPGLGKWSDEAKKRLGRYKGADKDAYSMQSLSTLGLEHEAHPLLPLLHLLLLREYVDPFARKGGGA